MQENVEYLINNHHEFAGKYQLVNYKALTNEFAIFSF